MQPLLAKPGLAVTAARRRQMQRFGRLLELLRPRAKRLTDFVEQAEPLLVRRRSSTRPKPSTSISQCPDSVRSRRRARARRSQRSDPFDERTVEAALRETATTLRHQGRRADSRHACGRHRAHHQPGTFRGAGRCSDASARSRG